MYFLSFVDKNQKSHTFVCKHKICTKTFFWFPWYEWNFKFKMISSFKGSWLICKERISFAQKNIFQCSEKCRLNIKFSIVRKGGLKLSSEVTFDCFFCRNSMFEKKSVWTERFCFYFFVFVFALRSPLHSGIRLRSVPSGGRKQKQKNKKKLSVQTDFFSNIELSAKKNRMSYLNMKFINSTSNFVLGIKNE